MAYIMCSLVERHPLYTLMSLHVKGFTPICAIAQSTCRFSSNILFLEHFFVGCDPQLSTVGGCLVILLVSAQAINSTLQLTRLLHCN